MPFSITVVVAFDMIGGFGTLIFVVVVTAGCVVVVVCFVVACGFAVVVALVVVVAALCVCIAVVVSFSCSVIGVAVVVIDVVALTGSCRADTGLLSVGCVVSRLVLFVADVGAVVALVVVVVTAGVCVVVRKVVVALLVNVVTLPDGFSFSVIFIADEEVIVTTSAPGFADCAQPDSRVASMSTAIAFFISVTTFYNVTHQLCAVAEALLVAALVADRGLLALDVAEFIEHFILLGGQRSFEFFVQLQPLFA